MQDEKRLRGQIAAAREMGEAAGLAQGLERGREEGREQGREEGSMQKAVAIARKLVDSGMPQGEAAAFVGIPVDRLRTDSGRLRRMMEEPAPSVKGGRFYQCFSKTLTLIHFDG